MQLSKMVEEEEAKKERDEEFEELQETSAELESDIAALKEELLDAQSLTGSLQQDLQASRYAQPYRTVHQFLFNLSFCLDFWDTCYDHNLTAVRFVQRCTPKTPPMLGCHSFVQGLTNLWCMSLNESRQVTQRALLLLLVLQGKPC